MSVAQLAAVLIALLIVLAALLAPLRHAGCVTDERFIFVVTAIRPYI